MRQLTLPNALILSLSVASMSVSASAQILASDSFSYTGALTANGWAAHSGAGAKLILSNGSVATLNQGPGSGEDVNLPFTALTATDTVFASFTLNVPSGTPVTPPAAGLYFAHFKDTTTLFRARTGVVAPTGGGDFRLAIHADSSNLSLGVSWSSDQVFNTDYKVVISWDAATGVSQMWIDPTSVTDPSITHTGTFLGTIISQFALRQASDYTGLLNIDDVVVGRTFADVCGTPGSYTTFGAGCASSAGIATNTASPVPTIGVATTITLGTVPNPAAGILLIGSSNTFSNSFGPLPLDLTFFGAPGCSGRVSDDVATFFGLGAGSIAFNVAIPNDPFFVGLTLYTQGLVFENVNALGIVFSDAATMVIGG
ncbi:MAG: hypothetical protein ABL997_07175 [Planctomycetota bacterium]